jgi:hypothetical protein
VNEGLLKHAPSVLNQPGSFGSVVFRFTSFHARNLYAAVAVSLHGGPIGFRVNAYPAANSETYAGAMQAGSREGIWWQPHAMQSDLLIFSNSSEKILAGTLWLSDAAGKRWNESLSLAAHQTTRLNVHELLSTSGLTGQYGGIQFQVPVNAGALDSVHLMYDETAKSSISLPMASRYPGATPHARPGMGGKPWTTYAPMLALRAPDPAVGLPSGMILQPTILVRNTTAKPVTAGVTLNWRGDSSRGQVKLADLNLAPYSTQQLPIGAMQKQLGIPDDAHWALVTLSTAASPNDLVAIASSYDSSGRYYLDSPFSSNAAGHFAGGEWRADFDHNQVMAVTNSGQKPTNALLTLHYDNGQKSYEMQQAIQPGDQMWVNVGSLIRNRVPDRKGNVLPADAAFGTYDLRDLNPGVGSLILSNLALDGSFGFQAHRPDPLCCVPTNPTWDPDVIDFDLAFGTGGVLDVGIEANNSCTGTLENISPAFFSWWSGNTSVALVTKQKVQSVGVGATTGTAEGYVIEGQGSNCVETTVEESAPIAVAPQITQNHNLWYFGNGISAPTGFTLGGTSATLTAGGGGNGTYAWSITAGSSIAALQGTTSGQNLTTVTIASTSHSTSANDVTVQLQLTPSGGSAVSVSYSLSVDSPYKLVAGQITNAGASGNSCTNPPSGTGGFQSKINYTILSFLGVQITNIGINENFADSSDDYIGNNWPVFTAGGTTSASGAFYDNICVINATAPPSLPPQSPLSSLKIDHVAQTWWVGSTTPALGVEVQSDTLQRYQDHGMHLSIVSPAR